jgi:hypothetical protein
MARSKIGNKQPYRWPWLVGVIIMVALIWGVSQIVKTRGGIPDAYIPPDEGTLQSEGGQVRQGPILPEPVQPLPDTFPPPDTIDAVP